MINKLLVFSIVFVFAGLHNMSFAMEEGDPVETARPLFAKEIVIEIDDNDAFDDIAMLQQARNAPVRVEKDASVVVSDRAGGCGMGSSADGGTATASAGGGSGAPAPVGGELDAVGLDSLKALRGVVKMVLSRPEPKPGSKKKSPAREFATFINAFDEPQCSEFLKRWVGSEKLQTMEDLNFDNAEDRAKFVTFLREHPWA